MERAAALPQANGRGHCCRQLCNYLEVAILVARLALTESESRPVHEN